MSATKIKIYTRTIDPEWQLALKYEQAFGPILDKIKARHPARYKGALHSAARRIILARAMPSLP